MDFVLCSYSWIFVEIQHGTNSSSKAILNFLITHKPVGRKAMTENRFLLFHWCSFLGLKWTHFFHFIKNILSANSVHKENRWIRNLENSYINKQLFLVYKLSPPKLFSMCVCMYDYILEGNLVSYYFWLAIFRDFCFLYISAYFSNFLL